MADYVSIVNLAAQKLGEDDRLTERDENTHLGRTVAGVWDVIRLAVLADHPWNFAMKRWQIPSRVLSEGETIAPYSYAYPLPEGMLRFHEIIDPSDAREEWSREGGDILSMSAGPLIVRGVQDVQDTALWDPLFVEAFASRLAFQIADRITGDRSRRSDCWAFYTATLRKAKSVDGRANPPIPASVEEPSWVTARYGD